MRLHRFPQCPQLHAAKARRAAARESMQCGMCKYVVNTVKAELDDAPTLASLKAAALQVGGMAAGRGVGAVVGCWW